MIPRELEAEILRLYHTEHWPIGTVSSQMHVHHSVVRRVLAQAGVPIAKTARASMVEPYGAFIAETLKKYPTLRASRLYSMVRERGYPGAPDHFRSIIARLRPRPAAEAYLRLRTLPGAESQCDWGAFGKIIIGSAKRALMAFVMVLSYSRDLFLRFFPGASMSYFLRGHVEAFSYFDAVPRAIRYVRDAFFAAREFRDLDDLNAQALAWCQGAAADRPCPEDRKRSVREVFAEERPHLLALPENPFPCEERLAVSVGKTPYARFDLNDYTVPPDHVQRTVVVMASLDTVRILDGDQVIATHQRSFDRGKQIEDLRHIATLVKRKHAAHANRAQDRLHHAAPSAKTLFLRAASRSVHLGVLTRGLIELLDSHGAQALEAAIVAALAKDAAHLGAVRHFIDAHAAARGQRPPIAVALPKDPRLKNLSVRAQPLTDYDELAKERTDGSTDDDDPKAHN